MGRGPSESYTVMRVLYYPPLPPSSEIKPGQIRCGEHVDYGSITLLFQDPNGGLQVQPSTTNPIVYEATKYMICPIALSPGPLFQRSMLHQE